MMVEKKVEDFVRQTLGCKCPDEVFRHIDCQYNITLNNNIVLRNKINIGNRLLIYVVETNDADFVKNKLAVLVSAGKNERETQGFNRLRLVIATDNKNVIGDTAESIFKTLDSTDEKIHLHIILRKALLI
jgi:hypothetical protein